MLSPQMIPSHLEAQNFIFFWASIIPYKSSGLEVGKRVVGELGSRVGDEVTGAYVGFPVTGLPVGSSVSALQAFTNAQQ